MLVTLTKILAVSMKWDQRLLKHFCIFIFYSYHLHYAKKKKKRVYLKKQVKTKFGAHPRKDFLNTNDLSFKICFSLYLGE